MWVIFALLNPDPIRIRWACCVCVPPALTTVGSPDWSILAVISWANLARTVPFHIWMAEILQHILPAAQPYLSHAESCLSPRSLLSVPYSSFFLLLQDISCYSWLYLINYAVSRYVLCPFKQYPSCCVFCVLLYRAVPGYILLYLSVAVSRCILLNFDVSYWILLCYALSSCILLAVFFCVAVSCCTGLYLAVDSCISILLYHSVFLCLVESWFIPLFLLVYSLLASPDFLKPSFVEF